MVTLVNSQFQEEYEDIRLYFDDIASSKPLSREAELELADRIKAGDLVARDELVKANLRFVVDVVKQYQNRGLPLVDLISAGNLGLITAAERFDGAKGFKFITYAVWWIKQAIKQTIAEQSRTVRLPLNQIGMLYKINKAARLLQQTEKDGKKPSIEEIAEELGVSAKEIQETLLAGRPVHSLDAQYSEEDDRTLLSTLADEGQAPPDKMIDEIAAQKTRKLVQQSLEECLDERERFIINRYFGLDGNETTTLEQTGDLMNLTRERVRQLKERALRKLCQSQDTNKLRELID